MSQPGKDDKPPTNIIQFPSVAQCRECEGKGLVVGFTGRIKSEHRCPRCNGAGFYQIRTERIK